MFKWIGETHFIASKGDTGLTGNIYSGLHDFVDMSFVLHCLKPNDLFLDIGANCGSYSILASGVAGARTIAFEPLPATFQKLKINISVNQLENLVSLQNYGLGDSEGELVFTTGLDTANHIVLDVQKEKTMRIPIKTLDSMNIVNPTLMKIDVEGFEWSVFKGAGRVLSDQSLKAIIVEINDSGKRYGHSGGELISLLKSYGFKTHDYDPWTRQLRPQSHGVQQNVIFVRDFDTVQQRLQSAPKQLIFGVSL